MRLTKLALCVLTLIGCGENAQTERAHSSGQATAVDSEAGEQQNSEEEVSDLSDSSFVELSSTPFSMVSRSGGYNPKQPGGYGGPEPKPRPSCSVKASIKESVYVGRCNEKVGDKVKFADGSVCKVKTAKTIMTSYSGSGKDSPHCSQSLDCYGIDAQYASEQQMKRMLREMLKMLNEFPLKDGFECASVFKFNVFP